MRTLLLFLLSTALSSAYSQNFLDSTQYNILKDKYYGPEEQQVLDLILPQTDQIHSLLIYVHGRGFQHGDKSSLYKRKDELLYFLEHDIAVATINYRFYKNNDSLGVKRCLGDAQRALQYLRHKASTYHLDKNRVAMYGRSAGAGTSLFLGLNDDLAIPNDTTLAGESTHLSCIGAFSTQATYDLLAWKKFLPCFRLITILKHQTLYHSVANFYGYPNYKAFKKESTKIRQSLDMLNMIDAGDPPVYIENRMKEWFPKNNNVIQHHRRHASILSKILEQNKVEHYVLTKREIKKNAYPALSFKEFVVEKLK